VQEEKYRGAGRNCPICNILMKNMGPFCCPSLLLYAVPI